MGSTDSFLMGRACIWIFSGCIFFSWQSFSFANQMHTVGYKWVAFLTHQELVCKSIHLASAEHV